MVIAIICIYECTIVFRSTQAHSNADALSRLPLRTTDSKEPMSPSLVLLLEHLAKLPVTMVDISKGTRRDPILSQVLHFVQQGWPNKYDSSMMAYCLRKTELPIWMDVSFGDLK